MKPSALLLLVSSFAFAAAACGEKKPAEKPTASEGAEDAGAEGTASSSEGDAGEKKDVCTGFELNDLEAALNKVACEIATVPPADLSRDVKDKLEVKVLPLPTRVAPGGKVDLVVTFTNKTAAPMPLYFTINPTPKFEVEAYDAKNKRADMPPGNPPPPPKGVSMPSGSTDSKIGRVVLVPNGKAQLKLSWEASKMRWAPEKVKGSSPDRGYPRAPSGPLPKGKYTIKVVTPMVGVSEGVDHEISVPKVEIEVGG